MKSTLFKCKHILSAGYALGAALLAGCAGTATWKNRSR